MSEIKCTDTVKIICPYCGYEFHNSSEHNEFLQHGHEEIECSNCDEVFFCEMEVKVSYNSYKK